MGNQHDDIDASIFKDAQTSYGKGKKIAGLMVLGINPVTIVVVTIIIFILYIIIYSAYSLLFGWTFKIEQDLEEAKEDYYVYEDNSHFNSYGYYRYMDTNGDLWYIYYDINNEKQKVREEEFLKDAYCFSLLMESGEVDVSTGDTLLLDDSDIDNIFDAILDVEKLRYEYILKTYKWGSK